MSRTVFKRSTPGFTIAELLIVIVVIGILATITTIIYSNTQTDAKTNAAKANAYIVQKKIESYLAGTGNYPTDTSASAYTTTLNTRAESALTGTNLYITGTWDTTGSTADPTKTPSAATRMSYCTAPSDTAAAGAYKLEWYDFKNKTAATTVLTGTLGINPCTIWQPLS